MHAHKKTPIYFYPEHERTAIDVLQEERDDDLIDDAEAGFMMGYLTAWTNFVLEYMQA